jgi:hypothetical protein
VEAMKDFAAVIEQGRPGHGLMAKRSQRAGGWGGW